MLLWIALVYHRLWFDCLCPGGDVRSSSFNPSEGEGAAMSWMGLNESEVAGSSWSFHPRKPQRRGGRSEDRTGMKDSNCSKDDFIKKKKEQIIQSQGERTKRESGLMREIRFKSSSLTWEITSSKAESLQAESDILVPQGLLLGRPVPAAGSHATPLTSVCQKTEKSSTSDWHWGQVLSFIQQLRK